MSDNATKPYLKADDIPKLPAGKADQRIPYGDDPLQFGDLRLPSGLSWGEPHSHHPQS